MFLGLGIILYISCTTHQKHHLPSQGSGDDAKRPSCLNLRTVWAYSAGAGTAGGSARAGVVGSSHATTTKDSLLPGASKIDSGRRGTWWERRKYYPYE